VSEQRDEVDAQDQILESMAESIELLNVQSTVLNERVYTKNHLDRTRNFLIVASLVFFIITSSVLGFVLLQIKQADQREANRSEDRAAEAVLQRRQFADCQVPPGTPLLEGLQPGEEPYINPGVCFKQTQERGSAFLSDALTRIFEGVGLSEYCVYLRSQNLRPSVCSTVNKNIDSLKVNENPFTTVTPTVTTTTTIRGPTSTAPKTAATTSTRLSTTSTTSVGLLCSLLRLVGVVC
jgi:hypothetical protein